MTQQAATRSSFAVEHTSRIRCASPFSAQPLVRTSSLPERCSAAAFIMAGPSVKATLTQPVAVGQVCDMCSGRLGELALPLSRTRGLTEELEAEFRNRNDSGMWSHAEHLPGIQFRVINNTAQCKVPKIIIFKYGCAVPSRCGIAAASCGCDCHASIDSQKSAVSRPRSLLDSGIGQRSRRNG